MTVIGKYLEEIPRDEYVDVCFCCGWPLTSYEIAAELPNAGIINYRDHTHGTMSAALCSECLDKMQEYVNGGPDAAYRRVYLKCVFTDKAERGEE